MKQQEIFKNMTKGEWLLKTIAYQDGTQSIRLDVPHIDANETAKAIAVNNTYGKGINPESVEKMHAVLRLENELEVKGWFEYNGEEYYADTATYELLNRLKQEALTAATLH